MSHPSPGESPVGVEPVGALRGESPSTRRWLTGAARDLLRSSRREAVWTCGRLLAGCLIAVLMTGCDPVARYRVQTFFFTGVPPMGQEEKEEEQAKQLVVNVVKKRSVVVSATRFTHGPYALNACYLCHETSESGGFRGFGQKKEAAGSLAKAGAVSGKLVAPMGELCASCHDNKSPAKAHAAGLWVHGPVSTGYCVLCHGPHAGSEQHMLPKNADALCQECHAEGLVFNRAAHKDRNDCSACHNAHLGKDSRLLKADYKEAW